LLHQFAHGHSPLAEAILQVPAVDVPPPRPDILSLFEVQVQNVEKVCYAARTNLRVPPKMKSKATELARYAHAQIHESCKAIMDHIAAEDRVETAMRGCLALAQIARCLFINELAFGGKLLHLMNDEREKESPDSLSAAFVYALRQIPDDCLDELYDGQKLPDGTPLSAIFAKLDDRRFQMALPCVFAVRDQLIDRGDFPPKYTSVPEPVPAPSDDVISFDGIVESIRRAIFDQHCYQTVAVQTTIAYELGWEMINHFRHIGRCAHPNASLGTKRNALNAFLDVMSMTIDESCPDCQRIYDLIMSQLNRELGKALIDTNNRVIESLTDDEWKEIVFGSDPHRDFECYGASLELMVKSRYDTFPGLVDIWDRLQDVKKTRVGLYGPLPGQKVPDGVCLPGKSGWTG